MSPHIPCPQTEAHNDTHHCKLFEINPTFSEMESNTLILQMDIRAFSDQALYLEPQNLGSGEQGLKLRSFESSVQVLSCSFLSISNQTSFKQKPNGSAAQVWVRDFWE